VSGKIVNLRTKRKRRDRADAADRAAQNRALHGRTKTERQQEEARRDAAQRAHEGRRIEPEDDRSDPA
jgi:hypothetical protein